MNTATKIHTPVHLYAYCIKSDMYTQSQIYTNIHKFRQTQSWTLKSPLSFKLLQTCWDCQGGSPFVIQKNPENHTYTLKFNILARESHRKLKLGFIELNGNTE